MKRMFTLGILFALVALSPLPAVSQNNKKQNTMNNKTLVAFFSCTGNTKQLAGTLAKVVEGDLFEIQPAVAYTAADLDWHNENSRSSVEMKDKSSRPTIARKVENMDQYDVIYVGFPIWWYIAPTIINTFLESYDFSGKTVIPFCTSGSSQPGDTDKYLKPSCSKDTKWQPAKRFAPDASEATLKAWVKNF